MYALKKTVTTSTLLILLATGVSTLATAQDTKPYAQSKAAKADASPPKVGELSADGQYIFQGDAAGWELAPHAKVKKDGKWVHVDKLKHDGKPPMTVATKVGDYSADGKYIYKGGDTGWELAPHKKVRKDGKCVHVDAIPKNTPTAPAPTAKQLEQDRLKSPG